MAYVYLRVQETCCEYQEEIEREIIESILDGFMLRGEGYVVRVNDIDDTKIDIVLKYPFNKHFVETLTVDEFRNHEKFTKIMSDAFEQYVTLAEDF